MKLVVLGVICGASLWLNNASAHGEEHHPHPLIDTPQWQGPVLIEALSDEAVPQFVVEAGWPQLPENSLLGQISGVAVDASDNVWLVQRPKSISNWELGLEQQPAKAQCCKSLPEVVQFSADGRYLQSWSGSKSTPELAGLSQWPNSIHGIFIDHRGDVWLAGNGNDDHVVLHYDSKGNYKGQFGRRGRTAGNLDKTSLGKPADIYLQPQSELVFVADGYLNRRVISFQHQGYQFNNYFDAYAEPPKPISEKERETHLTLSDGLFNQNSHQFSDIVHCVVPSNDGLLYVCDRRHNRFQVFKPDPTAPQGVRFIASVPVAAGTALAGTVTDIAFSPDQTYLYAADMANSTIWIYRRDNYKLVGKIGRAGRQAGQFTWLHSLAADSKGNLYATEVGTGMRIHKLRFTGVGRGATP